MAPRAPGDSVRPRRLAGADVRPLNFTVRPHVSIRAVMYAWTCVGLSLAASTVWGLATEDHSASVVEAWLIVLAFSILAVAAGLTFGRGAAIGRVLVRVVSSLTLLYSAAWLLLGGVDDAPGYWPGIIVGVALSIYSLVVSRRARAV